MAYRTSSQNGRTPLMCALDKGDRVGLEVAELLAQAGDTLNARPTLFSSDLLGLCGSRILRCWRELWPWKPHANGMCGRASQGMWRVQPLNRSLSSQPSGRSCNDSAIRSE